MHPTPAMILTATLLGTLAFAQQLSPAPNPDLLKGVSPQQALRLANSWRGQGGLQSYVTSGAVHFTFPDGRKRAVALPRAQMVVAIAPYIHQTHPCKTHFTSGCQGELVNTPVNVHVTTPSGKTVLRKTVRTLDNGFLEVWLPRGQRYNVTLTAQGRTTRGTLATLPGSDTCVTTLRLR
ncbi:CueP family metal-binding protein [Deinococcus sp. NW-56]|uniref:CueP family metal-binding protein n=1 Tax=Deinococcus sp. NW-56 TaxID=2080419 RepID=UPI000CF3EF7C|nr:CueP family metal-binding protein [Deinococcus sp. NW-56]